MLISKVRPLIRFGINSFNTANKYSVRAVRVKSVVFRSISCSSVKFSMDQKFADAQQAVKGLQDDPDNDTKLKLYALFKQGSIGKCNTPKPGALDFVGRAKWNAWAALGDLSADKAKEDYISFVNELLEDEGGAPSGGGTKEGAATGSDVSIPGIKIDDKDGVRTVLLNRPEKKNALTGEMYAGLTDLLNKTANDPKVKFLVMRGSGDFFCSGNDLNNFTQAIGKDIKAFAKVQGQVLQKYVSAYIDFPKPLVAVVNGPAVGIAVTILGLFDVVYANETATFHTPFSALGQSPEGCSSYTFPKLMGLAQANDILMLNKKITAQEAFQRHLVTEIIPNSDFASKIEERISSMAKLPHLSLQYAKQLSRSPEKELLHRVNQEECERLLERWTSEDCMNAIANFFQKKPKL